MTYIEYLNKFTDWVDENLPCDKTVILYYSFLALFNKRRWTTSVAIDTPRLMSMAHTTNRNTAIRARDELIDAGFIEYTPGKKGHATEYRLLPPKKGTVKCTENSINFDTKSDTKSKNGTECGTTFGVKIDTQYGCESDTHIIDIRHKTKTEDKESVISIAREDVPFSGVQTAPSPQRCEIPTLDDVIAYAESRGRVDLAEKFFDYYDAADWHDQTGARVRSWRQKFISWENKEPKPQGERGRKKSWEELAREMEENGEL